MKRWIGIVLMIALAAAAGFAFRREIAQWISGDEESVAEEPLAAPSTTPSDDGSVWALGRIAPADGMVDVMGQPGDRLLELHCGRGDPVTTETVLGKFESELLREGEHRLVAAQLVEARERLAAETESAQAKLASAALMVEQAREAISLDEDVQTKRVAALLAIVEQAERDLSRVTVLVRESPTLVSQQEIERLQLLLAKAMADQDAAESARVAARSAAQYQLRLAESQRHQAELAVANVGKTVSLASLELQERDASDRLARSRFRSPIAGQVIRVITKPGSLVSQRPIVQVADLSKMVCLAEVAFDQVGKIELGQEVVAHSRAFGDSDATRVLRGRVIEVGSVAATPDLRQIDPFAAADRYSFEVRIEFGPAESKVAAKFVNMQVDVEFLAAKKSAALP